MSTFKFAGNGTAKDFLKDMKGLIVSLPGTAQSFTAAKTLAGFQALINPATTAAITATFLDIARGLESKTTAPEFITANTGFKEKTMDFPPEFTGHAFMSYEDYKTWFAADGKSFDFTPVLADGTLMCAKNSAGQQVGFSGRMFIGNFDLPKAGGAEKTKAHSFEIMFDDVDQFKNYVIVKPNFTLKELMAIVPVGVNIEVQTAYENSGGTVVIKATSRVTGEPVAVFGTTAEWKVISLSADTGGACTICTATSASLGIYTLTFKNSSAVLTGDFEIQAEKITASHVTYLSNVLNVDVT
jgi:hypothetical protein